MGGKINNQTQTMDGRLEICINNAWGSVCNNSFRAIDAQVACNQLVGFERRGKFLHIVHIIFTIILLCLLHTLHAHCIFSYMHSMKLSTHTYFTPYISCYIMHAYKIT